MPIVIIVSFYHTAHAKDGWYLSEYDDKDPVYNHKTIDDRIRAAKRMVNEFKFPGEVICDGMANEGMNRYAAHPERVYIIQDGRVVYQGGEGPFDYKLDEVIAWMQDKFPDRKKNIAEPMECAT